MSHWRLCAMHCVGELKTSQGSTNKISPSAHLVYFTSSKEHFCIQSCSSFKLQDKGDFTLKIQDLYFSWTPCHFSGMLSKEAQFAWVTEFFSINCFVLRNPPCPEVHHKLISEAQFWVPAANSQRGKDQLSQSTDQFCSSKGQGKPPVPTHLCRLSREESRAPLLGTGAKIHSVEFGLKTFFFFFLKCYVSTVFIVASKALNSPVWREHCRKSPHLHLAKTIGN